MIQHFILYRDAHGTKLEKSEGQLKEDEAEEKLVTRDSKVNA